jgi:hypothetical protein
MHDVAVRGLPSYDALVRTVVAAEKDEGWAARCADAGRHLALNAELIAALAATLRARTATLGPVLEVCAGDGTLAAALRDSGVAIVATDAAPPDGAERVERATALDALGHYAPRIVLGAFVPFDARVDRAVLDHPNVQEYVVLNARLGGALGSADLWNDPRWRAAPIDEVTRWMVSRHDAWSRDDVPLRRRGEAWRFTRAIVPSAAA